MNLDNISIQSIAATWLKEKRVLLDVLRLDEIHPVVSGNKFFKLRYYLLEAIKQKHETIVTFGGAYSNHIIATAFSCKEKGLKAIGCIRGEEPDILSPTLFYAQALGMQLLFLNRDQYKNKQTFLEEEGLSAHYIISEGGYGLTGAKGAAEIMNLVPGNSYTHIIASVGTGTMLAGLIQSTNPGQQIIGISSMKGNESLEQGVKKLLPENSAHPDFKILHQYHFGGYAKHPPVLVDFINQAWKQYHLPLDIVYTGKLFFAIMDLVVRGHFLVGSNLLMIHSGGLQGNDSLPKNSIRFS